MSTYLGITLFESVQERWESVGWDALTGAERECLAVDVCVGQISNGSLHQFLTNCDPPFHTAFVAGLRRIGAPTLAEIVQRAMKLFPGGVPAATREERWEQLRADLEAGRPKSDQLTDEFWGVYERENALRLMEQYAESHPDEFRGPRNKGELAQSRDARGIKLSAEKLAKLDRAKITDATRTSETCPACGQPMPSYRKTCKRCGRPRDE